MSVQWAPGGPGVCVGKRFLFGCPMYFLKFWLPTGAGAIEVKRFGNLGFPYGSAGSARMPAPTVVPATSAMAPASELVGGGGVKSPLGATALPAAGDSTDMRGGERESRLSDAGGSSGWCNSGASGDGLAVNVMLLTKNSGSMLLPLRSVRDEVEQWRGADLGALAP